MYYDINCMSFCVPYIRSSGKGTRWKKVVLEDPVEAPKGKDLTEFIGERRGIQGHQNSCYLDSTLFAMYGFTGVFEELILQQPQDDFAADIVKIMSSEIIYPLRM